MYDLDRRKEVVLLLNLCTRKSISKTRLGRTIVATLKKKSNKDHEYKLMF